MNQETLAFFIYKYTTEDCILSDIVYPLLNILSQIHKSHIIHRDLKPENIFIHNGQLFIGDFGYSCILEDDNGTIGTVGTIQYMAPEILSNYIDKTTTTIYKYEVDIWSIGIIIYELLFHCKPFGWSSYHNICKTNPTDPEFIKKCLDTPLEFPHVISEEAKDFLINCLCKNPLERASIEKLLNHPWILNHLKTKKLSNEKCPLQYDLTQIKNQTIAHSIHSDKKTSKSQCLLS